MTDNLFEQATQITKAHAYDILVEQVKELNEQNKELIEIIKFVAKATGTDELMNKVNEIMTPKIIKNEK